MSLVVMGTSYKMASIDERQGAAVPERELIRALASLRNSPGVREALLVSTCNRVEAYVEAKTDRLGTEATETFFRSRMGEAYSERIFYCYRGMEMVQHLFRVVCSLDSQVLGEAQILGQMRLAFMQARDAGACGEVFEKLFRQALHLGKRVRSETQIGSDSISLSTVAHQVARNAVEDLSSCRVLLVGAGEMASLAATYLQAEGVHELAVANRTRENALVFAQATGANVVDWNDLHNQVAASDVVFAMTGSEVPLIRSDELQRCRKSLGREDKPLVLVDESVPRNIDLACGEVPGVKLFDLEALNTLVDEGLARRMAAVPQVERLADEAEREFLEWMQQRLVTPTIKAMYEKGNYTVDTEFAKAMQALEKERGDQLSQQEQEVLRAYGNAIMKKLLHGPVVRLRRESGSADSYYYTGAARYLFGVETYPPGTSHRTGPQLNDEPRQGV